MFHTGFSRCFPLNQPMRTKYFNKGGPREIYAPPGWSSKFGRLRRTPSFAPLPLNKTRSETLSERTWGVKIGCPQNCGVSFGFPLHRGALKQHTHTHTHMQVLAVEGCLFSTRHPSIATPAFNFQTLGSHWSISWLDRQGTRE